eukprot:SAG11_NODE_3973_length_2127_cov_1.778600_1_plen_72_part_00
MYAYYDTSSKITLHIYRSTVPLNAVENLSIWVTCGTGYFEILTLKSKFWTIHCTRYPILRRIYDPDFCFFD